MMTLETLTAILGWATVVNIAILLLSTLGLIAMRGTITGIHARLFGLEEKDLGRAYFQYLAQFKNRDHRFEYCALYCTENCGLIS